MAYTTQELSQSGVYAILFPRKDMVYVGSARSFKQRWQQHRKELKANHHHATKLQNYWNKYGSSEFVFVILEVTDNLVEAEQSWLDAVQPFGDQGFNTLRLAYSTLGHKWSPLQKLLVTPTLQQLNEQPTQRKAASTRLSLLHSQGVLRDHVRSLNEAPKTEKQLQHARDNLRKINQNLSPEVLEARRQRMIAFNASRKVG